MEERPLCSAPKRERTAEERSRRWRGTLKFIVLAVFVLGVIDVLATWEIARRAHAPAPEVQEVPIYNPSLIQREV